LVNFFVSFCRSHRSKRCSLCWCWRLRSFQLVLVDSQTRSTFHYFGNCCLQMLALNSFWGTDWNILNVPRSDC
jgi:hypothetical protein